MKKRRSIRQALRRLRAVRSPRPLKRAVRRLREAFLGVMPGASRIEAANDSEK
jgi:hypothetical protein